MLCSYFLSVYLLYFFCAKIPSRVPHYIQSCIIRFLLAVIVSQCFLASDDWQFWVLFHRISSNWNLMFFSWWDWGYIWVWWRMITEIKCHFHLTVSRAHTFRWFMGGDVDLNHLAEIVLSPFPMSSPSLLHSPFILSKKVPILSLRFLRNGEWGCTSLRAE